MARHAVLAGVLASLVLLGCNMHDGDKVYQLWVKPSSSLTINPATGADLPEVAHVRNHCLITK